ncbi:hypothetical protein EVAR_6632_1 [Eumeta japonica]|uniref:Uncharacterized protein n=1 Tax=Eumeta variegata TaxID=151549 RepID=A0A4C1TLP0_EUMVA|nr:hypothetical protein EVAR_6632_1 [Eumeta japonica]
MKQNRTSVIKSEVASKRRRTSTDDLEVVPRHATTSRHATSPVTPNTGLAKRSTWSPIYNMVLYYRVQHIGLRRSPLLISSK